MDVWHKDLFSCLVESKAKERRGRVRHRKEKDLYAIRLLLRSAVTLSKASMLHGTAFQSRGDISRDNIHCI
jgi:hypothetical protein